MGWLEEVREERYSHQYQLRLVGRIGRMTEQMVSSVLPSTRASPPYWVSDGDAVPTDDSPMGLLSVACDCKEVIILVQTLHFCISF